MAQDIIKTFGHYEIVEKLGQGGMGVVYRARHAPSGRIVALKVMTRAMLMSQKARKRFMREAKALARLRHRNIVAIAEVGEANGLPFIAMEYIEGRSLSEVIKEGAQDEAVVAIWIMKIVCAVSHAHDRGIIHRDLKPANVLIDREGEPIVTDFGLAKEVAAAVELTAADEIIGTPNYMSPEQVQGKDLDVRTDVFALGGVLYSLLTCQPPFSGSTTSVMFKVVEKDPEPPTQINQSVSAALETICLKAMRKAPEDRYQTAQEMVHDISGYLTETGIKARPESRVRRLLRRILRDHLVTAAGVVCAVGIIAISAWLLRPPRDESFGSPTIPPGQADATNASAALLQGIDQLVVDRQFDQALAQCRQALRGTVDDSTKAELNRRLELITSLQAAAASALSDAPGGAEGDSENAGFAQEMAVANAMLELGQYDRAIAAYQKLSEGSLTAQQQEEVQEAVAAAQQLRDQAAGTPAPTGTTGPGASTIANGDRLLRACNFEGAASIYQTAAADETRGELTQRLIALRGKAASVLGGGRRFSVGLANGESATLCGIDRTSASLADTGGTLSSKPWMSLVPSDIYKIYKACLSNPSAEDRLNLGLLCVVLGLDAEAKQEFIAAVAADASLQIDVDRLQKLQLSR